MGLLKETKSFKLISLRWTTKFFNQQGVDLQKETGSLSLNKFDLKNFGNASFVIDKVRQGDKIVIVHKLVCRSCAKMVSNAKLPPSEAPTSYDRLAKDQSARMK